MEAFGGNDQKRSVFDWLNGDEMKALRQVWREAELKERAEDDAWWHSLSVEEQGRAFRQIVKLMHRAEVEDRGSYRHAMYEVFNLDYSDGLNHYMRLHNLIWLGLDAEQKAKPGSRLNDDERDEKPLKGLS